MDIHILQSLLILIGFSTVIVFLLNRIKLPPILGFLITGVIIGPLGLKLIGSGEEIESISEIGVILLLFVIGLEMSIKQLAQIKKTVFIGGLIEVGLTILLTALIYHLFGVTWSEAVFMGFLFSLSSTAIVLSILQDRNEISQPHGRSALGILIFQDIIVVPMMLVTPIMAGNTSNISYSILALLFKSALVLALTYLLARYVVPKLMYYIAKTRSRELFLLITITICFTMAFVTAKAGLSPALGAFLAGLIISESAYNYQSTSMILPFKELFTSFFFISVGMLLDFSFLVQHFFPIIGLVLALFLVKSGATAIAIGVLKYPAKTVLLTAFSLFQVGEFAFIMADIGIKNELLQGDVYQYFLAISICSMLLTPFVLLYANPIVSTLLKLFGQKEALPDRGLATLDGDTTPKLDNHLIIVGFGINGKAIARAAQLKNIPYIVLETNATTVQEERAQGVPILFGDATQNHILNSVNIYHARAMVIAVTNLEVTKSIIRSARSITRSIYLIVRTRFVSDIENLKALGANEVVSKELEASIEMFSRVMHNFLVPEDDIHSFEEVIRADNYQLFEDRAKLPKTYRSDQIPNFNITSLRVFRDSGSPIGISLRALDLRAKYGVNIIAISRGNTILSNLRATETIQQNDILYVQGETAQIEKFRAAIS